MAIPVDQYSGVSRPSNFNPVLTYLYDDILGSGVFRAVKPSDLLPTSTTVSNSTISGTNGDCLAQNLTRKYFYIQNMGTGNALFVKLGTNASNASLNIPLKPGNALDDGVGGNLSDDVWKGVVSVSGITPRYICWETT